MQNIEQSEKIEKFIGALFLFHKNYTPPKKDAKIGGSKNYSYLSLDGLIDCVRPQLLDIGIIIMQFIQGGEILTRLTHSSGEYMQSAAAIPALEERNLGNTAQQLGAAITYMRRYSITALLGISTEGDTDGVQQAVQYTQKRVTPQTTSHAQHNGQPVPQGGASKKQVWCLTKEIEELAVLDKEQAAAIKTIVDGKIRGNELSRDLCSKFIDRVRDLKAEAANPPPPAPPAEEPSEYNTENVPF